ncbi:MAG: hypothetical protein OEV91_06895, partial [Desulfobulbaceae bacterium]|nr:hypothetical protein [Desulfobulbaceae bacterium]
CLLLENSFDLPYIKPPLPEAAVAMMTEVARLARARFAGPVGIQMLEAANETALGIAAAARLDFVRVEGYVFAHIGGAGLIEGCAGLLHRQRKEVGGEGIKFFADLKKKHCSHALTADLDICDEARQAEFFLADGLIVTGPRTGEPPRRDELVRLRGASGLPLIIGSGITGDNLADYLPLADGFIVGSTFRNHGRFRERLDPERLKGFMAAWNALRTP